MDSIYNIDEAAVSLSYQLAASTAATTITGFIQFEGDLQPGTTNLAAFARVTVRKSVIAHPAVYDKITYAGTVYTVGQIVAGNKHNWVVSAYADPRQLPSNLQGA